MSGYERDIARSLEKIADSLETIVKMNKRAKHCFVLHSDDTFSATVKLDRNFTKEKQNDCSDLLGGMDERT